MHDINTLSVSVQRSLVETLIRLVELFVIGFGWLFANKRKDGAGPASLQLDLVVRADRLTASRFPPSSIEQPVAYPAYKTPFGCPTDMPSVVSSENYLAYPVWYRQFSLQLSVHLAKTISLQGL